MASILDARILFDSSWSITALSPVPLIGNAGILDFARNRGDYE
jgi:hypothetical protein